MPRASMIGAALEDRIDADLALGRHQDLVGELNALTAEHPLRERLTAQLMAALYRCGRQADALQVYMHARRRLVDELGIEPGPELRRLHQAVLDHDEELASADVFPRAAQPGPPVPTRVRRHPRMFAAAGAFLALATAAATLLLTREHSSKDAVPVSSSGDFLAALDPVTNRVVATVPLGATPTSVAVGAGAVWAISADRQTIARIDPRTKREEVFGVGATPADLAASARDLWVGSGVAGATDVGIVNSRVLRVDAASRTVRAQIEMPAPRAQGATGAPGQLTIGPGTVWALNGGGTLVRIDPRSGRVTGRVPWLRARSIASDRTSVWAIDFDEPTVVRVDPRRAAVRSRVKIPAARLDAIAAGAGAVWVADAYGGNLWRIDPGRSDTARAVPVGVGVDGVTVGAGAVWVINSLRGTVVRVDPRTNRVAATVVVSNTPRDVDAGAGMVWVTVAGGHRRLPAAAHPHPGGSTPLPGPPCGAVFAGGGRPPDFLIASDLPLQGGALNTQPIATAVAFVLRQHRFTAGRYRIGHQSCDSSTAESGGSDPGKCAANAKAYSANPAVLGVVGPFNSGCAAVEIPILGRARGGPLAMISPANSYVGLTHVDPTAPPGALRRLYPTGVRNYARVFPPEDAQAAADAVLARRLGVQRPYVLDDGGPYGAEMAVHFRRSARALGLRPAGGARWDPEGRGFSALAERVHRARADGIFLAGLVGSNGGPLTKALRARLGARVPFIAADAFGPLPFLFDASSGTSRGMYVSEPGVPKQRLGERGRRFAREFQATQPGRPVTSFAVYAAAATEILLDAIARSDGTRASVSRALMSTHLEEGILGAVRFDRNGDLVAPSVPILRVRRRGDDNSLDEFDGAVIDRVIAPSPNLIR